MRLVIRAIQLSVTRTSGPYTAIEPAARRMWSKYGAAIETAPANTSPRLIPAWTIVSSIRSPKRTKLSKAAYAKVVARWQELGLSETPPVVSVFEDE
jgi:hypothetical protein